MARNNITRRKKTHLTSELITSINKRICTYFDHIQEIFSWNDEKTVFINFDEVPLYFDMTSDYTIHFKGEKQVKVISHGNAKTRLTFMPCISHRSDILPPLFTAIYAYAAKSERTYPIKYERYMNQTSPFMLRFTSTGVNNEEIISEYITKVLKPWKDNQGVNLVVIFDEAACHLTQKVQENLIAAEILPVVIPGGATSLLQPLDVEINKTLKGEIRKSYTAWLEKQVQTIQGPMEPPELLDLIDWARKTLDVLTKNQVSKAFLSTGISKKLNELWKEDLLYP